MGFLGIKGDTWKKIGKIALKAAPIVAAPFTGGASLLALGAGTGALSGALGGGGWKGALLGGALGAIPGGGVGGAAAGGVAKAGLKEIAKGVAKGAATNFATGTATGLATGQGLKNSLQAGGQGALSGLGTSGTGGFQQAAKTVGKNVAMNVGGSYASKGLQKAGVPGGFAAQGGNVFSNYLGNQFNSSPGGNFVQPQGQQAGIRNYLPQGGSWQDTLMRAGTGALSGAQQGGGWKGALTGAAEGAAGVPGGGAPSGPSGQPMYSNTSFVPTTGGGGYTPGGGMPGPGRYPIPSGGTGPTYPNGPVGQQYPQQQTTQPNAQQPAVGADGQPKPPTWAERYGPLIAQGAGLVVGGLAGKKATQMAQQRSPEELAALGGAQGAAGQAGRLGGELGRQGQNYLQKPGQYFETLLGGNRAAMSQAVAGPTAQITGNYRGAERALQQQGVRGAARDQAVTDLNRERASKIAGLTTGMQPYAAEQLSSMGQNLVGQAGGLMNTSGNIYSNLLGYGAENRRYAREEGGKTAGAIGGLARDVGEVVFRRPQAPGTPAPPTQKKAPAGTPQAPTPTAGTPQAPQQPVQVGVPNMPPKGYPFGTPGDYDPNRAYT